MVVVVVVVVYADNYMTYMRVMSSIMMINSCAFIKQIMLDLMAMRYNVVLLS